MARLVAPVTVQLSVEDCPPLRMAGEAAKLAMTGRFPTVTVAVAASDPKALVAVSV
jgi:hypothetical protein